MTTKISNIKKLLMVLFVVLAALSCLFLVNGCLHGHFESAESMRAYIKTFGLFAPLILILIQMLQVIIPVIPGFLGCIVGTGLFGALGGFLCNYIGISLGSLAAFGLSRRYGVHFVKQMLSEEKYDRYLGWITAKKCFILVLWLSILLPLAPDDFLCYFSGLTRMSLEKFTWIILLAKPWCILVYCVFFDQLF